MEYLEGSVVSAIYNAIIPEADYPMIRTVMALFADDVGINYWSRLPAVVMNRLSAFHVTLGLGSSQELGTETLLKKSFRWN